MLVEMLLPENATAIAVSVLLIVLAFFYTGSSNRAFARGKPDNPPMFRLRIVLAVLGAVFILFGVAGIASRP
jgi:hypothetical protein